MEEDIPLKGRKSYFNQMYAIMHIHVANRLDKFQRNYLWEEVGDTSKYHLENWRVIWVFTSWALLINLFLEHGYGGLRWKRLTCGDIRRMGRVSQWRWCEFLIGSALIRVFRGGWESFPRQFNFVVENSPQI